MKSLHVVGLWGLVLLCIVSNVHSASPSFVISAGSFVKDGEAFRILSGSFHYFRVHNSTWNDTLYKMAACGLNTVQTYIPWNVHEPQKGVYNFDGMADLFGFLALAKAQGLLVTLRVGPYSCGEWEFGGLPYWLLEHPDVNLRSSDPYFWNNVVDWYNILLPKIKPWLYSNGGNVILAQVENEYGSYGTDKIYLAAIRDLYTKVFGDGAVVIYSTDGPLDYMLSATTIPGVFQTVDFGPGDDVKGAFSIQQKYDKTTGPLMNSEYYSGWLTHWGDANMASVNASTVTKTLQEILNYQSASVNVYMFRGGSNFGFMNGANGGSSTSFEPSVTSYDYDSPITEAGDVTKKYFDMCAVFRKYNPTAPPLPPPTPSKKGNYGKVSMSGQLSLFDTLLPPFTKAISAAAPYSFERLGLNYGYVLYRTTIVSAANNILAFSPKDRTHVFLDSKYIGVLLRGVDNAGIKLPAGTKLDLLVENMGRVNYGPYLNDPKGIPGGVLWQGQFVNDWDIFPLPITQLSALRFGPYSSGKGPSFFQGNFTISGVPLDTYLTTTGWTKGVAFINGFNVGRYWSIGPQFSLYIPAALLRTGSNEIIIFETDNTTTASVTFQDRSANV